MQEQTTLHAWEQSVAKIPDSVYLDIVRNFIGKVSTPFHKPLLTKQLSNLFTGKEFQNQLLLRLSDTDIRILTAMYLIGSPTQEEICNLFTGMYSYSSVLQSLVNLEERLLVVPSSHESPGRFEIMLNPLLEKRLVDDSLSLRMLFHTAHEENESGRFQFSGGDKNSIRALLSLHIHENLGSQDRSERLLESRYVDLMFGFKERNQRERIKLYNRMLFCEHVVKEYGRTTRVQKEAAQRLLALDSTSIQLNLCIWTWLDKVKTNQKNQSDAIFQLKAFFLAIFSLLDSIPIRTESAMLTAVKIAAYRNHIYLPQDEEVLSLLYTTGLHLASDRSELSDKRKRFKPTIDSDLTVSFGGELESVGNRDYLCFLARAKRVDVVCNYEIDKTTILRAFDIGLTVSEILLYLEGLTGSTFTSLKNLITQWREEFASITIYDGIVVKADERQSRIIEALPQVQSHLIATIAPGIFLFSRTTETTWRDILASTGNGILPSSIGEMTENPQVQQTPLVAEVKTPEDDIFHNLVLLFSADERNILHREESLEAILRTEIQSKARSSSEREEMLSRLDRKLILISSQVKAVQGPSQTLQASGFDHQGKINLCRSAVQSSVDLLELHIVDDSGESTTILAEAKELIYPAKDASIRINVLPKGEERLIPISRIFKVRKFKRSIFF